MRRYGILFVFVLATLSIMSLAHIDITVHDANEMLTADPDLVVIDVREANEYCNAGGHLPGAYNYPYNSGVIHQKYTDFDPSKPILVICRTGGRSDAAATFLDSRGFTKVYDIGGGTSLWDDYYPTVGCVDSDKDQVNDDLDNFPAVFNPTQAESIWLGDFSELAAQWQLPAASGLYLQDLTVFCEHWLQAMP